VKSKAGDTKGQTSLSEPSSPRGPARLRARETFVPAGLTRVTRELIPADLARVLSLGTTDPPPHSSRDCTRDARRGSRAGVWNAATGASPESQAGGTVSVPRVTESENAKRGPTEADPHLGAAQAALVRGEPLRPVHVSAWLGVPGLQPRKQRRSHRRSRAPHCGRVSAAAARLLSWFPVHNE
jgi:hypothetical protein